MDIQGVHPSAHFLSVLYNFLGQNITQLHQTHSCGFESHIVAKLHRNYKPNTDKWVSFYDIVDDFEDEPLSFLHLTAIDIKEATGE